MIKYCSGCQAECDKAGTSCKALDCKKYKPIRTAVISVKNAAGFPRRIVLKDKDTDTVSKEYICLR